MLAFVIISIFQQKCFFLKEKINVKHQRQQNHITIQSFERKVIRKYINSPFVLKMITHEKFGKQRLDDFYIDKTFTNLNHGSYGYTPKTVFSFKHQLQQQMEFNTQKWFRNDLQIMISQTRGFIAERVNAPKQNIFMVQNATDAINGLMKSLQWKEGDVILLPNTAYKSVRKTVEWLRDCFKIEILNVNFTLQDLKTPQSIQLKIKDTVNTFQKKIRCAVIDHISSMPSVVFPIHAIKQFLDQKSIDMFVDGAHAFAQVDIDIKNLNFAAYFSNLHKWAFTPKSAAFIYVSDKYLNIVRPSITGNFRGEGPARQYFWTGTRDCTAYLCVQKGVQYIESFGNNEMRNYNRKIVFEGAQIMAEIWKTDLITRDEKSIAFMACVILPTNDSKICNEILKEMLNQHNTYFSIGQFDGKMYYRVCGQIYNELEDYKKTAELFLQILKRKNQEKNNRLTE